jgi:ADP-ribose pyrophosphatase YjhB (NUDIX family)
VTPQRQISVYGQLGPARFGGPILHGEHPSTAVVRLAAEQLGTAVAVVRVLDVRALISPDLHDDQVLYEVVPGPDRPVRRPRGVNGRPVMQRFAAYGLATDPLGRILLAQIAAGYPGAGRWHLPGGGTDAGEQPAEALLRELHEETAQSGEVTGLLGVSHRHNPRALGPEGYPIDWHTVRATYRVWVPEPTEPTVTEAAGGSTVAARWFARDEVGAIDVTEVVQWAVSQRDEDSDSCR